jgi:[acyl-carrier-protein] S-malonyltransferase
MSLGLLCPGQGDQSTGMFDILAGDAQAQSILDIYAREIGGDPTRVAEDMLHANAVAQPLVCALQLATWAALREKNLPEPRAIAGYSVGELAAYGCAGALEPGEVIQLAKRRAQEMDAATPGEGGLMAVRGLPLPAMRMLCEKFGVEIAIVNDFDRLVIGGPREALAHCAEAAADAGAKVTPLHVAIASHTSLMRPAVANFRAALEAAHWRAPSAPVMAGTSGAPVYGKVEAIKVLARQVAETVNWAACLDGLVEMGCTVLLELGPGAGLSRMARERAPGVAARSVADFHSLDGVVAWVTRQLET